MPFVTVAQNPDSLIKYDAIQLEDHCKEAWEAMKYHSDAGPFEAKEVGGLMAFSSNDMTGKPGSCVLRFYYCERPDRGLAFREDLFKELKVRLPRSIDVVPVPTKYWFTDPVWAVKEKGTIPEWL